jgi:hypothetical protein
MKKTFLISTAAVALIAAAGLASAQTPGGSGSQGAPAATQTAPRENTAPMKSDAFEPKAKSEGKTGAKSEGAEAKPDAPATGMKADSSKDGMKDGIKAEQKSVDTKTGATTGQAATVARQLNTEQRTTIRTVIKDQNVKPATNVNFQLSVGTAVPRTVTFHPLPKQLVTIYPDWQGYEYFLVGDEIIVVNPRTLQIVAVLAT